MSQTQAPSAEHEPQFIELLLAALFARRHCLIIVGVILVATLNAQAQSTQPAKNQAIIPRMHGTEMQFGPSEEAKVYDVARAIRFLSGDTPNEHDGAIRFLSIGQVDDEHREAVLKLLEPEMMGDDLHHDLIAVRAYANWADRQHVSGLARAFDIKPVDHHPGLAEQCWAAALEGMLRLDPEMAESTLQDHIDSLFFRGAATEALRPASDSDTAVAKIAQRMIAEMKAYQAGSKRTPAKQPAKKPQDQQNKA